MIAPNECVQEAMAMVARCLPDNFGSLDEFGWATTAEEAADLGRTESVGSAVRWLAARWTRAARRVTEPGIYI
jgi:hypothetical protein